MNKPVATLNINAGQTLTIELETVIYEIKAAPAPKPDCETIEEWQKLEQKLEQEVRLAKEREQKLEQELRLAKGRERVAHIESRDLSSILQAIRENLRVPPGGSTIEHAGALIRERDALKAKANNAHQAQAALWESTKVQQLEAENKRLQATVDALPKYEGEQSASADRDTVQFVKQWLGLPLGLGRRFDIRDAIFAIQDKASKAEAQLEDIREALER